MCTIFKVCFSKKPVLYYYDLQRYSQSRWPHGSQPFHDFAWYNSWNSHKPWKELVAGMAPGGCSNWENTWLAALWIALFESTQYFVSDNLNFIYSFN